MVSVVEVQFSEDLAVKEWFKRGINQRERKFVLDC